MFRRILLSSFVFTCAPAFAWGNLGHQVIATIAANHLCPAAKSGVNAILNGEEMTAAAIWADTVRRDPTYKYIKPWHYISLPLNSVMDTSTKRSTRGDVVTAIEAQSANLANPVYANRLEALRMVLHFVGDAHQPFHAGDYEDGGGNGFILKWYGYPTNLHSVWDSRMFKQLNETVEVLAAELDSPAAPAVAQLTPEAWVDESSAIAAVSYPDSHELAYAYYAAHIGDAKTRLRMAGLRLAGVLNAAFNCTKP